MLVFIRVESKTVETKPVNQHMRNLTYFALSNEIGIDFSVDNCDLLAGEYPGILVEGAQRLEFQKDSSPCVRANKGEIAPLDAHSLREAPLKWTHRAFARCGRTLCHHRNRVGLRWQRPEALRTRYLVDFWLKE